MAVRIWRRRTGSTGKRVVMRGRCSAPCACATCASDPVGDKASGILPWHTVLHAPPAPPAVACQQHLPKHMTGRVDVRCWW